MIEGLIEQLADSLARFHFHVSSGILVTMMAFWIIIKKPHTTQAGTTTMKRHLGPEPAWVVGTEAAVSTVHKPAALCAPALIRGLHI